jgi:hypothetical protein
MHRVVFKLKDHSKLSQDYWIENYPVSEIRPKSFVTPLEAIGIIYTSQNKSTVYVPCNGSNLGSVIPASVLIYSGIGHRRDLEALGIPCLYDTEIT